MGCTFMSPGWHRAAQWPPPLPTVDSPPRRPLLTFPTKCLLLPCPGVQATAREVSAKAAKDGNGFLGHLALKNGALLTEVTLGPRDHFVSGPSSRSLQLHLRETWRPEGRMYQSGGFRCVSKSPQPLETAGDILWTWKLFWEKSTDFVQHLREICEPRRV